MSTINETIQAEIDQIATETVQTNKEKEELRQIRSLLNGTERRITISTSKNGSEMTVHATNPPKQTYTLKSDAFTISVFETLLSEKEALIEQKTRELLQRSSEINTQLNS